MSAPRYQYCPMCRTALAARGLGGRDRLVCPDEDCGFVHWNNPAPVVAAIVERAGRVVLVRSHGWPQDWYGLVTGFLETGERPEEAVLREVQEELGIEARFGDYIGAYPFERLNQIIFVFHLDGGDAPIRLCAEELADHKEVPIDELRPWPMGTGPALRDWLATRGHYPPVLERTRPTDP